MNFGCSPCAVSKMSFSTTWDLNKFPKGVRRTLPRPNVAGYSQDANFVLQIQKYEVSVKTN